jgi:hypothetical protein
LVEINLLKHSNQLFDDGSSRALTKDELFSLTDDNNNVDVLVLGLGTDDSLKVRGDLGSRYFIKEIQYYIDSPIISNLVLECSSNGEIYSHIEGVLNIGSSMVSFTVDDFIQYMKITHAAPAISYANYTPKVSFGSSSLNDTYGSKYINNTNINDIYYYDSSNENWMDTSTLSWFNELPLIDSRGRRRNFPHNSLIVCTSTSLDILDMDKNELWIRFNTGSNTMLGVGVPYRIFAINGCIYVSMKDSSVILIDFKNDTSIKFTTSGRFTGNKNISQRHTFTTYTSANSAIYPSTFMTNSVNQIRGAMTPYGETVALATISGVSVIIEKIGIFNSIDGTLPTVVTCVSPKGNVYWGSKLEVSEVVTGEVSYTTSLNDVIMSGTGISNYFFCRTNYYDSDTTVPFILNEDITSMSVV